MDLNEALNGRVSVRGFCVLQSDYRRDFAVRGPFFSSILHSNRYKGFLTRLDPRRRKEG